MEAPFGQVIATPGELRELYREPHKLVQSKVVPSLDATAAAFIARSPFVLLATSGADGSCDVSPRGGPAGFVRVLDDHHVALPDLNGNNLLDSTTNVVANGHVGLLFVVPGKDETLRVNGRAWVTTDPAVLDRWEGDLRRPKTAIGVQVEQVYIHCAKAFRRGRVWEPEAWAELAGAPSAAEMLTCQVGLDAPVEETQALLEEGYAIGLAKDRPEPAVP